MNTLFNRLSFLEATGRKPYTALTKNFKEDQLSLNVGISLINSKEFLESNFPESNYIILPIEYNPDLLNNQSIIKNLRLEVKDNKAILVADYKKLDIITIEILKERIYESYRKAQLKLVPIEYTNAFQNELFKCFALDILKRSRDIGINSEKMEENHKELIRVILDLAKSENEDKSLLEFNEIPLNWV
jgi:hypothetical protein